MTVLSQKTRQALSSLALTDSHNSDVDELLLAFEMLFKVGSYYPPNHQRSRQITERVQTTMTSFLDGQAELVFELEDDNFLMQGEPVPPDIPGARNIRKLLGESDIVHLSLSADISHDDLHVMVQLLPNYWRRNTCAPTQDRQTPQEMPVTIHVRQREFLGGPYQAQQTDLWQDTRDKIRDLLAELTGLDLDKERITLCQSLAESFLRASETGEALTLSTMTARMKSDQTLDRLHKDESSGLDTTQVPEIQQSLDKLISMLEAAAESSDEGLAHESLDLLISLLNQTVPEIWKTVAQKSRLIELQPATGHTLSIAELEKGLNEYDPDTSLPGGITPSRSEMLSTYMQMLTRKQTVRVQEQLEHIIIAAISGRLGTQERTILVDGMVDILVSTSPQATSHNVALVIACFRQSDLESSLDFLRDICTRLDPKRLENIWPHLVNEILIGRQGESDEVFEDLCRQASSIPSTSMDPLVPALLDLDANRNNLADESFLLRPNLQLVPVYAAVMRAHEQGRISDLLAQCLDQFPPPWIGIAVLPLIRDHHDAYRPLYAELMLQANERKPSGLLREMAGAALSDRLPALTSAQRKASWVPNSIRALARLSPPDGKTVLHEVLSRRRLRLFPVWSGACRRAAREELYELEHGPIDSQDVIE